MALLRRAVVALSLALVAAAAIVDDVTRLTFSTTAGGQPGLQIAGPSAPPTIQLSANEFPGAVRAANDLAADFGRVIGTKASIGNAATLSEIGQNPAIIVGTVGSSKIIDALVASKQLDVSPIVGKWESYVSQVVADASGKPTALVIAGSDMRGTIFGIYDVSEQIGVSPWYWWADVPAKKRQYIFAPTSSKIRGPPTVKYRGFFLNDEAPALSGWAKANYPTSQYGNAFNSDFYSKVFELILRLKGNYLLPAEWSGMFYVDDTKSGPLADQYGVFMGTSHTEPMARAEKEQGRFCSGAWDWSKNKGNVQKFMTEGVQRSKSWATVYTMGMRGSGDAASPTLTSKSLEEVIKFQQSTLQSVLGKNLSNIPQSWGLYKVGRFDVPMMSQVLTCRRKFPDTGKRAWMWAKTLRCCGPTIIAATSGGSRRPRS